MIRQINWDNIRHFHKSEFNGPDLLIPKLIYTMDELRNYIGRRIHIHCDYEKRDKGYHPLGMAIDFHAEGMHFFDLFLACTRFDQFNGIGVYPDWNNPGVHVDVRPKIDDYQCDSRWLCVDKNYIQLNTENIKKYL